jgi:hypothetical protein
MKIIKRFRDSRIALLLDCLCIPLYILLSVIWNGTEETWLALKEHPRIFKMMWKQAPWC